MRAIIATAFAALALTACAQSQPAENTMNADEAMMTENVAANDGMAMDAATNMSDNAANAMDANAMNGMNSMNAMNSADASMNGMNSMNSANAM